MTRRITIVVMALVLAAAAFAEERYDKKLLQRVFVMLDHRHHRHRGTQTYDYSRFLFRVERRNPTLLLVPSVYAIARGAQREYTAKPIAASHTIASTTSTLRHCSA
jgi:hypothetical protein